MKKAIIGILLFFAAVYFGMVYYFEDVEINKYADTQVVKENQLIQKGWVPAILPESAYDIAEMHDLDKNTLFGTFRYKEKDEETFLKNLTVVPDANDTLEWGSFLFKIDKEKNQVKYRNKPVFSR